MQRVTSPSQREIHAASGSFRHLRGVCRGSGRVKTSSGRARPSRGRRGSVSESECGSRGGGGAVMGRGRSFAGVSGHEASEAETLARTVTLPPVHPLVGSSQMSRRRVRVTTSAEESVSGGSSLASLCRKWGSSKSPRSVRVVPTMPTMTRPVLACGKREEYGLGGGRHGALPMVIY
ncbi:hypothetical protein BDZ97DRAFT_73450 [Flammula alnicola]|nr:hypothetical protein BDZ97DRAFT_73450 [Flammula alnicola]